ncbi:MAG TPA: serine/threonine protein kinase, partial [Virgibacillus sp.]|nr:serine/threonine protein kinase [Virgibacillus sp.]
DTDLEEGSTVDVYISIGEEEKPPTFHTVSFTVSYTGSGEDGDVTDEDETDVNNEENENEDEDNPTPQDVQIYIGDMNHDITDVYKEDTIITDTEYTITLTIEEGEEADYKVVRDGEVIRERTISYEEGE